MQRLNTQQSGVALVVVLLLLVVITLLGLAAMRETIMQERMAGYTVARGYAFQAAENALRQGEDLAKSKPAIPAAGCTNGICARPAAGAKSLYETDSGFWDNAENYRVGAVSSNGITPKYTLEGYGTRSADGNAGGDQDECLGDNCGPQSSKSGSSPVYRITVLSRAANGTEVMLQSLFQAP